MYGQIPLSRWNHSLVAVDDDKLVVFGVIIRYRGGVH